MLARKFKHFLRKFDHILLLLSLVLFISSPIWETLFGSSNLLNELAVASIVVAGLSVVFSHRSDGVNFMFYWGIASILLSILQATVGFGENFSIVAQTFQIVFFLVLTWLLFHLTIRKKIVDSEVVVNAINGYLLLGVSWAIIITIFTNFQLEAFSFTNKGNNHLHDEVYFAFVTLTTLGYGDSLPLTPAAKMISILIAITGAFYSTIVLGMIVGKYISNETVKQKSE